MIGNNHLINKKKKRSIRNLFLRFIDGIIIALGSFDCPLGQRVIS